jgi:hypothetical protein
MQNSDMPVGYDFQMLAERIKKLERQNRLFKRGGIILVFSCFTLLLMGQARPAAKTVEAQDFVLRDASGAARAELSMLSGEPFLRFFDSKGSPDSALTEHELTLLDTTGRAIFLSAGSLGPVLSLYDSPGKQEMSLGFATGMPGMVLTDANGQMRALLAASTDGANLDLYDEHGDPRASFSYETDHSKLVLSDAHGFSTAIGNVDLVTPSTGESRQTSAASLRMFNDKGDVIWAAP